MIKQCSYAQVIAKFSSMLTNPYYNPCCVVYTEASLWIIKQDKTWESNLSSHTFHNTTPPLSYNSVSQNSKFKSFIGRIKSENNHNLGKKLFGFTVLYSIKSARKINLSNRGMLPVKSDCLPRMPFLLQGVILILPLRYSWRHKVSIWHTGTKWHLRSLLCCSHFSAHPSLNLALLCRIYPIK